MSGGEFHEREQVFFAHGLHVAGVNYESRRATVNEEGESREHLHGTEECLRENREGQNLRERRLDALTDLAVNVECTGSSEDH